MKPFLLLALVFCLAGPAHAAELRVDLGRGLMRYQTQQLLHRMDVRSISIPADVAFHRAMHYRAVPLAALLQDLAPGDQLQFVANDGFIAGIPAALVLNRQGSTAWLAIEDNDKPWPRQGKDHGDAGPFYVVWTRPEAAGVTSEQWPYQLNAIRLAGDMAVRFPAIFPDPAQPAGGPVQRGFVLFKHTCFACHTLNRQGDARLGPDLNVPYNPTQYLRADLLRAFIRDPQSLRHWPQAKMHGMDRQALSDDDLDAVLAYLKHMAGRKVEAESTTPHK
jgi:mono/diheme cytochrome c family protein